MRPIAVPGLAATAIAAACAAAPADAGKEAVKPGLHGTWDTTGDGRPAASLLGAVAGADKGRVTMVREMSGCQKDDSLPRTFSRGIAAPGGGRPSPACAPCISRATSCRGEARPPRGRSANGPVFARHPKGLIARSNLALRR